MGLDILKLENVKDQDSKTIARCPACAAEGGDHTGDHLIIWPDGRFGCVAYPEEEGHEHRQRIFALVGIREPTQDEFKVKSAPVYKREVIIKDILGRLGHLFSTYACSEKDKSIKHNNKEECKNSVPDVPKDSLNTYIHKEVMLCDKPYRNIFK